MLNKKLLPVLCALGGLAMASSIQAAESYTGEWDSLSKKDIPEWIKDAKFGVYTHWGIYSVPAHGGPDYETNLYGVEADRKGAYSYHTEKYGELKDFGYSDFIPMFTAPKFNADEWVAVMHGAGAKFGGIALVHHDGFLLWDSKVSRWNAKNMGPKRNIYGEIAEAVGKYPDMKLAATFHHGRTIGYARKQLPEELPADADQWDIFDPQLADFFWDDDDASKARFSVDWEAKIKEVIDTYNPDFVWFDGLRTSMKNDHPPEQTVKDVMAYYYNEADKRDQDVVIANKHAGDFNFPTDVGLLSFENGRDMAEYQPGYWLSDRAIGYPWSYVNNKTYRDGPGYQVDSIVDIVSRGGILLLSLTPKGDGSIAQEEQDIMRGIGRWMSANGEAIYSTRRYSVYGEGTSKLTKQVKVKDRIKVKWDHRKVDASDVRFTQKDNTLYAISLQMPENRLLTVNTLTADYRISTENKITRISLLDSADEVKWTRDDQGLHLNFPEGYEGEFAHAFKIEVAGELIVTEPDAESIRLLATKAK
ncbi:MAG: alpha-L-fucosidase [Pseudomonadales bacterium]